MRDRAPSLRLSAALLFIVLAAAGTLAPSDGPHVPESPDTPAVRPAGEDARIPGGEAMAVVVTAKGERRSGSIMMPAGSLDVDVPGEKAARRMTIPFAEIASIDFLRWRGREIRKNEFAFYPDRARITLREGRILESQGNIAPLNRLTFKEGGRARTVFAYFHDYRKKGRWVHSGEAGIEYPETHPHGGTIIRIIFEKPAAFNPLEMLFRK